MVIGVRPLAHAHYLLFLSPFKVERHRCDRTGEREVEKIKQNLRSKVTGALTCSAS